MLKQIAVIGLALALGACFGLGQPPPGPPLPPPPGGPDLSAIPWATDYEPPVTCSTAEKPAKHQPPGSPWPIMVPDCVEPEPPEEPEPPPVADGCYAPSPTGSHWDPKVPATVRPFSAITARAIMAVRDEIGDPSGQPPEETLALVAAKLRALGFCASGPWVDALAIEAPGGGYEEWHLVGYTGGGWTQSPFKGTWYLNGAPEPPTPDSPTCGVPVPEREARWRINEHGTSLDAIYQVYGPDFCAAIGLSGRQWCPVRKEGHPQRRACEAQEYGTPVWTYEADDVCSARENPHLFRCKGGQRPRWAEVCTEDGRVCQRWMP